MLRRLKEIGLTALLAIGSAHEPTAMAKTHDQGHRHESQKKNEKPLHIREQIEKFFKTASAEQLQQLFTPETEAQICTCIDERNTVGSWHLPGSGILEKDPLKVAKMLFNKKAKTKIITGHKGCGAAALATKEIEAAGNPAQYEWYKKGQDGKPDVDGNAQRFAQAVANKLSLMYESAGDEDPLVEVEFLDFDNFGMVGNREQHEARAIYYNMTKRGFNLHALDASDLPPGFVVNDVDEKEVTRSAEKDSLILSIKIAFGHHGVGEEGFSRRNPLEIFVLAEDYTNLLNRTKEVETALLNSEFKKQFSDGKIKISSRVIIFKNNRQNFSSQAN